MTNWSKVGRDYFPQYKQYFDEKSPDTIWRNLYKKSEKPRKDSPKLFHQILSISDGWKKDLYAPGYSLAALAKSGYGMMQHKIRKKHKDIKLSKTDVAAYKEWMKNMNQEKLQEKAHKKKHEDSPQKTKPVGVDVKTSLKLPVMDPGSDTEELDWNTLTDVEEDEDSEDINNNSRSNGHNTLLRTGGLILGTLLAMDANSTQEKPLQEPSVEVNDEPAQDELSAVLNSVPEKDNTAENSVQSSKMNEESVEEKIVDAAPVKPQVRQSKPYTVTNTLRDLQHASYKTKQDGSALEGNSGPLQSRKYAVTFNADGSVVKKQVREGVIRTNK